MAHALSTRSSRLRQEGWPVSRTSSLRAVLAPAKLTGRSPLDAAAPPDAEMTDVKAPTDAPKRFEVKKVRPVGPTACTSTVADPDRTPRAVERRRALGLGTRTRPRRLHRHEPTVSALISFRPLLCTQDIVVDNCAICRNHVSRDTRTHRDLQIAASREIVDLCQCSTVSTDPSKSLPADHGPLYAFSCAP